MYNESIPGRCTHPRAQIDARLDRHGLHPAEYAKYHALCSQPVAMTSVFGVFWSLTVLSPIPSEGQLSKATSAVVGYFPTAPHDLLCPLSEKTLINLCWSSVTPGTMEFPDEPGDTTW